MRAERHDVVDVSMAFATAKTPSTMEAVYRPLCQASASSVAALPVPRHVERFVNSRPSRQLHRWHSGIIGHGRTDWMKSDNCRFSSSHDPKHTLEEGGGKGGRGGQRDRQPRPARFRANSCNEIDQTDCNTVLASDSVDKTGGCGPFTRMPYRRCAPSSPPT